MFDVIIKHAPRYFGGSAFSALIGLLMLKYYTYVFDPVSFGILSLYLVMFKYITTIVSLNLDSAATRFYFDYHDYRRDEYLSTIFWLISVIAICVFIVALIMMDTVSNWIAPNTQWIYFVTLVSAIVAVYVSFLMRILYNEQKSLSVLKQTLIQTLIHHISAIVLIKYLGMLGRIAGQGLGYVWNFISLLREFTAQNLFTLQVTFNTKMASETFLLSWPTTIASIQTVLFIYLDRIFIKHYLGDTSVGVYTLGYLLGQGLSMVYEAVSQALLPRVYQGLKDHYKKSLYELEKFAYVYYLTLVALTVIISVWAPYIVGLFSNDNYGQASLVMPFIMAGFMMGGLYKIPSLVLGFHKVVWFYPFLAFISFGANVLFNWLLIPQYGIIGAGFASFIGLYLYSMLLQILSFTYMSTTYHRHTMVLYLGIGIVTVIHFWSIQ